MNGRRVLVVDDDPDMAAAIADILSRPDTHCEILTSPEAALAACRHGAFDVVVSDVRMDGIGGVELMTLLRRIQPSLPVILITAEGSIGAAVAAMKSGAFQYLVKPVDADDLRRTVDDAALVHRRVLPTLHAEPSRGTSELVGRSEAMTKLRAKIELVAAASLPVLVLGETGTGKELVARAIHRCSPRHARPFVTVNAAAVPEHLLESEMFGHARGAFTGATQQHRGLFSEADGGTLFLDEIGDMPLGLQSKLLRVLQSGELCAVGSSRSERVDVRIVAATHRNPRELIARGAFREDLYYRLAGISINVPPLRARSDDIAELATSFVARARERAPSSRVRGLSAELLAHLAAASWPGNVRELQSTVERLVVLVAGELAESRHLELVDDALATAVGAGPGAGTEVTSRARGQDRVGKHGALDDVVRAHVEQVLAHTGGNKARAAKILGVDLSTLYRWQQKWK